MEYRDRPDHRSTAHARLSPDRHTQTSEMCIDARLWFWRIVSLMLLSATSNASNHTNRICIISSLRLKSLYKESLSKDLLRDSTEVAIWSSGEVNAAILASCLPTIKACFDRLRPNRTKPRESRNPSHITPNDPHSRCSTDEPCDDVPYASISGHARTSYDPSRSTVSFSKESPRISGPNVADPDMQHHIAEMQQRGYPTLPQTTYNPSGGWARSSPLTVHHLKHDSVA